MAETPTEILAEINAQLGDLPDRLASALAVAAEPDAANPSGHDLAAIAAEPDNSVAQALDSLAAAVAGLYERLDAMEQAATGGHEPADLAQGVMPSPDVRVMPGADESGPPPRQEPIEAEYELAGQDVARQLGLAEDAALPGLPPPLVDAAEADLTPAAETMQRLLGYTPAEPIVAETSSRPDDGAIVRPAPEPEAGGRFPDEDEPLAGVGSIRPPDLGPGGLAAQMRPVVSAGTDAEGPETGDDVQSRILAVLEEIRDALYRPDGGDGQGSGGGFTAWRGDPDEQHFSAAAPSMPYGNMNGTVQGFGMDHGSRSNNEPAGGQMNFRRTPIREGR